MPSGWAIEQGCADAEFPLTFLPALTEALPVLRIMFIQHGRRLWFSKKLENTLSPSAPHFRLRIQPASGR